jgi:predicted transcriptional regulator of viral defense system
MNYKAALLQQDKKIFKTDDLAVIWGITNRNTLLTTIKRYLKQKILFSIRKGLYSVIPPQALDPFLLGTAYVKGFCYVSLQTVLAQHGVINQQPQAVTLVGARSQEFMAGGQRYICRKMAPQYLYNLRGIQLDKQYPIASLERAIADTLYYNPNYYFDQDIEPYGSKIATIQQEVFHASA